MLWLSLTHYQIRAQITNTDLDLMANYADYLNDTFNCNIEVNYDTGELTGFDPERLVDNLMETSDNRKLKVSMDYLSDPDMQSEYVDAYKSFRDKSIELAPFKTEYDRIMDPDPDGVVGTKADLDDLAEKMKVKPNEVDEVFENLQDLQTQYEKYDALLKTHADTVDGTGETYYSLRDSLQEVAMAGEEVTKSAEEANNAILTPQDAARDAMSEVADEILELSEAYDGAYICALESFQGSSDYSTKRRQTPMLLSTARRPQWIHSSNIGINTVKIFHISQIRLRKAWELRKKIMTH